MIVCARGLFWLLRFDVVLGRDRISFPGWNIGLVALMKTYWLKLVWTSMLVLYGEYPLPVYCKAVPIEAEINQ